MSRLERLEEIKRNREERERRGRYLRELTTQQFHKSMQMLQANALLRPDGSEEPFEDYSIFLYRMTAPDFSDRVKHLEQKLLYPVRQCLEVASLERSRFSLNRMLRSHKSLFNFWIILNPFRGPSLSRRIRIHIHFQTSFFSFSKSFFLYRYRRNIWIYYLFF